MYSAVIVDDEPWALIGIRNSFPWQQFGFNIALETSSAGEALEYIVNNRPDVVFTDIRMDEMSGIDLMNETRKLAIDSEFVVISGYDDFSYAQQAIGYGVFRYILKPIDIEMTENLLGDLADKLAVKKEKKPASNTLDLLLENKTTFRCFFEDNGIAEVHSSYYAVTFRVPDGLSQSSGMFSGIPGVLIKTGIHKTTLIINSCTVTPEEVVLPALKECGTIGLSTAGTGNDPVLPKIRESDIALCNDFIYSDRRIFCYEKIDRNAVREFQNPCMLIMKSENPENICHLLSSMEKTVYERPLNMESILHLYNQIVTCLRANNCVEAPEEPDYLDYSSLYAHFKNVGAMFAFFKDMVQDTGNEEKNLPVTKNKYLREILDYIHGNYHKPLFLSDLSGRFFISQTYICDLFKKYAGKTFNDYITELRINKALELLADTRMDIIEIADAVGYQDYYYFNRIFKKRFGMTPLKYRQTNTLQK